MGELPWYFFLYLKSCEYNPQIHFYIYHINNKTAVYNKIPSNVNVKTLSIFEFKKIVKNKIGYSTKIDANKLNDYKPCFGLLFEETLKNYDYWGHNDLDIIYGNISKFIYPLTSKKFDIINCRHDYIAGCFCLYKNTNKVNNLFKNSVDFETVYTKPKHYCFDECNFIWGDLNKFSDLSVHKGQIESFSHVVNNMIVNNELYVFNDFIIFEGIPGNIKWEKGCLSYKNSFEGLLYHLVLFKKNFRIIPGDLNSKVFFTKNEIFFDNLVL